MVRSKGGRPMIIILFLMIGLWLFTLFGWWYESRYRKKIIKAIKSDLHAEIRWYEINHYQDQKEKEIKTYRKAIEIVDKYDFDG